MKSVAKVGTNLNPDKCAFGKSEIKFLALIISKDDTNPNPDKVSALQGIKRPIIKMN